METLDLVRALNAVLAAACLGFWIANSAARWRYADRHERSVMFGVGFLLTSIAYLAGGAVSDAIAPLVRACLMAAPLAFLLGALSWDRRHRAP